MTDATIVNYFQSAKRHVDNCGFRHEYEYQRSIIGKKWSERDFLREYAWVILSSGFREQVVRKWFSFISLAFFDFVSAKKILRHRNECKELALSAINNNAKVASIIYTAARINECGFVSFQKEVQSDPIGYLVTLPYIGKITSYHLLKNLGFDVAKNDRHLQRISDHFDFEGAEACCKYISKITGEPIAVVDIILWRNAVLS